MQAHAKYEKPSLVAQGTAAAAVAAASAAVFAARVQVGTQKMLEFAVRQPGLHSRPPKTP